MSSWRQRGIPLGGRFRQVSLYLEIGDHRHFCWCLMYNNNTLWCRSCAPYIPTKIGFTTACNTISRIVCVGTGSNLFNLVWSMQTSQTTSNEHSYKAPYIQAQLSYNVNMFIFLNVDLIISLWRQQQNGIYYGNNASNYITKNCYA